MLICEGVVCVSSISSLFFPPTVEGGAEDVVILPNSHVLISSVSTCARIIIVVGKCHLFVTLYNMYYLKLSFRPCHVGQEMYCLPMATTTMESRVKGPAG